MTFDLDKKFRFRNFDVYKSARKLSIEVKSLSKRKFPDSERYCLSAQLWRAMDSVVLNIAEGSDKGSDKDFAHFISISRGSLNEVVACLDIALDCEYIVRSELDAVIQKAAFLGNQLSAFRKKLLECQKK